MAVALLTPGVPQQATNEGYTARPAWNGPALETAPELADVARPIVAPLRDPPRGETRIFFCSTPPQHT